MSYSPKRRAPAARSPLPARYQTSVSDAYVPLPNPFPDTTGSRPGPRPATSAPNGQTISNTSYSDYTRTVYGASSQASEINEKYNSARASLDSTSSKESGDGLLNYTYPRSTSEKFYTSADPSEFYQSVYALDGVQGNIREDDDYIHNPSPRDLERQDGTLFTRRGLANLGCLFLLLAGITFLFAGYPLMTHFTQLQPLNKLGAYNLGGINSTGQVPQLTNFPSMIDSDTPQSALHHTSLEDGTQWDLIFSDEFNTPNRSFYPGDDPYWEAVDLHYHATNDLEWYDPIAVTTEDGSLKITLDKITNHELDYRSGMLQGWNKMCFTGGYVEVSVSLPGLSSVSGLWPAIWTMGNLGRAGYGATTDGTWPYSYDSCDVGTLANQTLNGQPAAANGGGDPSQGGALSFLPGQRLSACTCPGEIHPGPTHPDGSFVGRSAPEIDVLEAIVGNGIGQVSQSMQVAPYDDGYNWANTSADATVHDPSAGAFNNFRGGVFQESVSGLFTTNQFAYSGLATASTPRVYSTYGFEYKSGLDGYVSWVSDAKPTWTARASAVGPNPRTNVSARPIPQEPMYLLLNLGISPGFGVQSPFLQFPATMFVDYVRVYQNPAAKNIGCSPPDYPTEDYINHFADAYNNPNMTIMAEAGIDMPKNRLIDTC